MMGWAAGFFGGGGGVLVVGCLVGMSLLMWLLFRLTGDSSARIIVQPRDRLGAVQPPEAFGTGAPARSASGEQAPSGPAGSGSVAP
jgi:hypothetical protein